MFTDKLAILCAAYQDLGPVVVSVDDEVSSLNHEMSSTRSSLKVLANL